MTSLVSKVALRLSSAMRGMGAALDNMGKQMEVTRYTEKLVPSTRFVSVDGIGPTIADDTFVAPSASLIGDVTIGKASSVWYGAIVRGDVNTVTIGDCTSICDGAVIHVAKIQGDIPTTIGDRVLVRSRAMIHAATIGHGCVVGENAQVLDGSVVHDRSFVEPASIVTPGTVIPSGQVWGGSPASYVRDATDDEMSAAADRAERMHRLACEHTAENAKGYEQILEEIELADIEEHKEDLPIVGEDLTAVQGQGEPGMIFRDTLSHPEEQINYMTNLKKDK